MINITYFYGYTNCLEYLNKKFKCTFWFKIHINEYLHKNYLSKLLLYYYFFFIIFNNNTFISDIFLYNCLSF
jgi:hypothetical protein